MTPPQIKALDILNAKLVSLRVGVNACGIPEYQKEMFMRDFDRIEAAVAQLVKELTPPAMAEGDDCGNPS